MSIVNNIILKIREICSWMPNTIKLQSILNILIRFDNNLIKMLYLTNSAYHLYENMMLSILSSRVSIANLMRAFLHIFLQSSIFCLTITTLYIMMLAWIAKLYLYAFSFFLSINLVVLILISFVIAIFLWCLYYLLVFK